MKNTSTFVVVSTKGGPGKTTISRHVLPSLFIGQNKTIRVHELDNNNNKAYEGETTFLPPKNSEIEFYTMKARGNEAENAIFDISFDHEETKDIINIIDAGGGDDSLQVLNTLKNIEFENLNYIIPINSNKGQILNALQTISAIRKIEEDANITVVLNRLNNSKETIKESIKSQFFEIFKNSTKDKNELPDGIKLSFVLESTIFSKVESENEFALSDLYAPYADLIDNIQDYKKEWRKEGKEKYKAKIEKVLEVRETLELIESFNPLKETLGIPAGGGDE